MNSSNKEHKFRQGTTLPKETGVYICATEEISNKKTEKFWRACYFDNGNVTHNSKPRWMTYSGKMFCGKVIYWFDTDIRDNKYHKEYENAISAKDRSSVLSTFGKFAFPDADVPTVDTVVAKREVISRYSKLDWMIEQVKTRTELLRSNPIKWVKNREFINAVSRALDAVNSEIQEDENFDTEFLVDDDFQLVDEHVDNHKRNIMRINKVVNEKIYNLGY